MGRVRITLHSGSEMEICGPKGIKDSGRFGALKQDVSGILTFGSTDEIIRISAQPIALSGTFSAPLTLRFLTCTVILGSRRPGYPKKLPRFWVTMVLHSSFVCLGCLQTNIQHPPHSSGARCPLLSLFHKERGGSPRPLGPRAITHMQTLLWGGELGSRFYGEKWHYFLKTLLRDKIYIPASAAVAKSGLRS